MNKLLYLLFFFSLSSIAQQQDCGWYDTMKPEERMKQFPFNKARRITLVSYPGAMSLKKAAGNQLI
ncbi:hypothetical protein ACLI09_09900 [Flavobacterium sp. RHBU_24]|uniref:hypothetical protein n=1 Tax=Flavobacterium sp. RHBU_24 TaxID=3391185 RepID=UPI00398512A5